MWSVVGQVDAEQAGPVALEEILGSSPSSVPPMAGGDGEELRGGESGEGDGRPGGRDLVVLKPVVEPALPQPVGGSRLHH